MNDVWIAVALALALLNVQFPGAIRDDADAGPGPAAYDAEPAPRPAPRVSRYSLVVAQDVPAPARDAYRRGLKRYRDGKPAEAAAFLREAVSRYPDYFDANLALGVVEGASGRFAACEAALSEAIRVCAREPRAHLFRGIALIGLSDAADPARREALLTEASAELDRAWGLSAGTLPLVHLQRARIDERRGDKAAAAAGIERYLDAVPKAPNAPALRAAAASLRGCR